jgi:cytochrome P450
MPLPIHSPREARHDLVIAGVKIPKGTDIMILPPMIYYNPCLRGNDVEKFDPDRRDSLTGAAACQHAFDAVLLGCIGRVVAMIEFKVILIEILSKFRFETYASDTK